MEKPRREAHAGLDLSQKWLRHLREASMKTTRALPCRYCRDRKVFPSDEALLDHMLEVHPDRIPLKTNTEAFEKFKETLKTPLPARSNARPNHDGAATKMHEEPTPVESESPKLGHVTLDTKRSPSPNSIPLAASSLQTLGTELKKKDSSRIKSSGAWASRSIKETATGHGRSPSSSVRTTYSNDSPRRVLAKGTSPSKHISSPNQQVASLLENESEIVRPPTSGKRLFEPDSNSPFVAKRTLASNANQRPQSSPQHSQHRRGQSGAQVNLPRPVSGSESSLFPASILASNPTNDTPPQEIPQIVRQPETRPISQEQLVAEVKGIYAGLVMVEGKCIQVDAKQATLAREAPAGSQPKLNNEQWQALIALHRTLLHEHHDFFLASQHPSATPAVRKLAIKYAMPARLWRHGIHSFLELLRNRLPDSLDHMLAFIYLAYSMMTLLYETVPKFEETWIECLGDLGRYRMAIEDDDIRDREVWTQVARQWYLKASDRSPKTGKLYHHLAILARPNALQQLFYYCKALSLPQPFVAARESVLTLFEPIIEGKEARRLPSVVTAYVKVHAVLFAQKSQESFATTFVGLSSHLNEHIGRVTQKYLEQGYYIAISNILALLRNSLPNTLLVRALSKADASEITDASISGTTIEAENTDVLLFEGARQLFVQTIEICLQRVGDPNILSFLHITMVFLVFASYSNTAMRVLDASFPWKELVTMLNTLLRFNHNYYRIEGDLILVPDKNDFCPTAEEFALRGQFWTVRYFIPGWFRNKSIEDESQYKEDASMNTDYRSERILWLGCQLAKLGNFIHYENHKFSMPGPEKNDFLQNPPYDTAPAFEETWTKCLGDLGRYRISTKDESFQDREIGSQVARKSYRSPKTCYLYHHLADLTRPSALQHLFDHHKAVSIPRPFLAASESISSLFDLNLFPMSLTEHTQSFSAFTRRLDKRIKCITQLALSNLSKLLSSSVTSTARYAKSLTRILTDLKTSILLPVYMKFIKGVTALPTGSQPKIYDEDTSDAFMLFLEAKLKQFTDEMAGPLLLNLCSAIVLIGTHVLIVQLDRGPCKDWDLLLIVMNTTSLGLVFLAIDESYSGWQLAILWGFTASFIITYLKGRLINLKLSGINAVFIVTLGIAADTLLATYATFPGRLAEPWILGSIAVLPCISFFTCVWVAFLHQTGLIHAIEDESRINSVLDFLGGIWTAIMIWHGIRPHRHSE